MPVRDLRERAGHPRIVALDEREAAEKILLVCIEPGGYEDDLRPECLERRQHMALEGLASRCSAAAGGERNVHHVGRRILRAAVGIEGMLEESAHEHPLAPRGLAENVLGAVAVMYVEVDDGDTLEPPLLKSMGGRDRHVVEYAKPHGPVAGCMMSAGPHGAKRVARTSLHELIDGEDARAGGAARRRETEWIHRGVGVEAQIAAVRSVLEDEIHIARGVHARKLRGFGERRLERA